MAKDVNLLDDDEGEGLAGPGEGGRKGGGALKLVLIGLVLVGLVGGSAAASYYFWWEPRQRAKLLAQKRAEERHRRETAQERRRREIEEVRYRRELEEARREAERRQRELEALRRELEALRRVREMAAAPKPPEGTKPAATAPNSPEAAKPLIQPTPPEEKGAPARAAPRKGEKLISKEARPPSAPKAATPPGRPPEKAVKPVRPKRPKTERAPPLAPRRVARGPRASAATYAVRVAACVTESCVRVVREKMEAKGISTYVGRGKARLPLLDVVAGDFSSRQQAEKLAGRIRRKGLKAKVVPLGDSRFRVSLGAFLMAEDAHIQLDRLEEAGFSGSLETGRVFAPLREVRVGRFATRAEALAERRKLRQRGIPSVVVRR
ncbi:MAG: SPOR domain-containing protein [Nitrospinota bacterium]